MALVVLAIAVVHAERLERAPRPRRASRGRRRRASRGAGDVIELTEHDGVAVLRMADGKANAMSIEFCASADRALCRGGDARAPWS